MQVKSINSQSDMKGQLPELSRSSTTVDKATSGVSREFHSFVADIEDLIKATTSLTGDDLAAAKVKLNERIAAARDAAAEISDTITQRVRKSATVTNNFVHDKPWQAIGIGTAVGVLLGFVIGRRS